MKRTGQFQTTRIKNEGQGFREVALSEIPIPESVIKPKDEHGKPIPVESEAVSREELLERAKQAIASASNHYLEWEGPWAVCQSCPFRHSVPLDFRKYDLVNGKPVKKPIAQP